MSQQYTIDTVSYKDLHGIAQRLYRFERVGSSLSATDALHFAILRGRAEISDTNEKLPGENFKSIVERNIRRVFINRARGRSTQKRGGNWARKNLDQISPAALKMADVLVVKEALERLKTASASAHETLILRAVEGYLQTEVATILGRSRTTIAALEKFALGFLHAELNED